LNASETKCIVINPKTTKCYFKEFNVSVAGMTLERIGINNNNLAIKLLGICIDKLLT